MREEKEDSPPPPPLSHLYFLLPRSLYSTSSSLTQSFSYFSCIASTFLFTFPTPFPLQLTSPHHTHFYTSIPLSHFPYTVTFSFHLMVIFTTNSTVTPYYPFLFLFFSFHIPLSVFTFYSFLHPSFHLIFHHYLFSLSFMFHSTVPSFFCTFHSPFTPILNASVLY